MFLLSCKDIIKNARKYYTSHNAIKYYSNTVYIYAAYSIGGLEIVDDYLADNV